MPELVQTYDRLCELAGGGDHAARFLSHYKPPVYMAGCSQAVWPGSEPLLVRNYDYALTAFDGLILETKWLDRTVLGMSDCAIGLLDGINDVGLSASLTFGGRRIVGEGFGAPIILRYLLEVCETVEQAKRVLQRVPSHMAYNITVLDAGGDRITAFLSPDRKTIIHRVGIATNHQENVEWTRHAQLTASVERERFLLNRLTHHFEPAEKFVGAFLKPPLYSTAFAEGFGTLYTAAYWPARGQLQLTWPGSIWPLSIGCIADEERRVIYDAPANSFVA